MTDSDAKLPPLTERRAAHTDAERTAAMAAVRTAQAEFVAAEKRYKAAVKARERAAVNALRVGWAPGPIALVFKLASASNVTRMWSRHHGEDPNAGDKVRMHIARRGGLRKVPSNGVAQDSA